MASCSGAKVKSIIASSSFGPESERPPPDEHSHSASW